jgi:hypothetical protein
LSSPFIRNYQLRVRGRLTTSILSLFILSGGTNRKEVLANEPWLSTLSQRINKSSAVSKCIIWIGIPGLRDRYSPGPILDHLPLTRFFLHWIESIRWVTGNGLAYWLLRCRHGAFIRRFLALGTGRRILIWRLKCRSVPLGRLRIHRRFHCFWSLSFSAEN